MLKSREVDAFIDRNYAPPGAAQEEEYLAEFMKRAGADGAGSEKLPDEEEYLALFMAHSLEEPRSGGELVPDELTNKIVKDRLAMDDAKNGWILDGYPRNAAQVQALDEMLADLGTPLDNAVALEAARDVLLERMAKRAAEQGRSDDTPEAIAKRLETYERETAPLLDIYENRGMLVVVNGVGEIAEINARIVEQLGE